MHPEEIKAALRMRGVTQAVLAEKLQVSRSHVSMVIAGVNTSKRVEGLISMIIGKPVKEIWPNPRAVLRRNRANLDQFGFPLDATKVIGDAA
jgi:lambda repressor-like predicted transcriptional regulator